MTKTATKLLIILMHLTCFNIAGANAASFNAGGYNSVSNQFSFVSSLNPISYLCNPNTTFGCFSNASFGKLGVSAFHDFKDPFFNLIQVFSTGGFSDFITVNAPNRAGTRGIARINYTLEGKIDFSQINARDAASLYGGIPAVVLANYKTNEVDSGAAAFGGRLIRLDYNNGSAYDLATFVSYDWHFIYGIPTEFSTELELRVSAGFVDFSNTLAITGITAFDENGETISATFVGDTGVDYAALARQNRELSAVPEPQSWLMMLLGFWMVGLSIRKMRLTEYFRQTRAKGTVK
jgi:hypothetical protein